LSEMDEWVAAASAELGLSPADIRVDTVLDLARDVAHQVLRPGAPVTAYLMGVAVGRGADPAVVAGRLTALAASWPPPGSLPPPADDRPRLPGGRLEPPGSRPEAHGSRSEPPAGRPERIDPPIG